MAWNNLNRTLKIPDQDQIDTLSQPSIMDSVPGNPDSDDQIQQAKQLKFAQDSALNGGAMGIISDAGGIAKALGGLKNPSRENVLKAIEYSNPTTHGQMSDTRTAMQNVLGYATKENMGSMSNSNPENLLQDALNKHYPEISQTKLPMDIDPNLDGYLGQYRQIGLQNAFGPIPGTQKPVGIILNSPSLSTGMHEAEHYRNHLNDPYTQSRDEIIPGNYDSIKNADFANSIGLQNSRFLADKIKAVRPELNQSDINTQLMQKINEIKAGRSPGDDDVGNFGNFIRNQYLNNGSQNYDFITGNHFTDPAYKTNYELNKAVELLNNQTRAPIANPVQNKGIIDSVFDKTVSNNRMTPKEIQDTYIQSNFPNIREILDRQRK